MTNINTLLNELMAIEFFKGGELCVVGCSTSEVIGERIGTHSSDAIAEEFYEAFKSIETKTGVHLCFQGCEHINRAITMERDVMLKFGFEPVTVMPHKGAGGSMSATAYRKMKDPVVVEAITAHCGIDIGQTLIGMHIKHVQIPVRVNTKKIDNAIVTIATHRPKLIGGERATYSL